MLWIELSTLRLSELRTLLATARARGQDALVEQLEAEIAARASGRAPRDEPDPEPLFENDDVLPIDVGPPLLDLAFEPSRPPPRRRWPVFGLVAAGVVAGSAALAWGLSGAPGLPRGESPPASAVTAAAPPAPRAMTVRAEPVAPIAEAPPVEAPAEPEPQTVAKAEPSSPRSRLDPCARPPTAADRLLCSDLALNLLEHEMREAYGRALTSGVDPIALRDSQAAWRRTRDPIADPRILADAYDRRIRELQASSEAPAP